MWYLRLVLMTGVAFLSLSLASNAVASLTMNTLFSDHYSKEPVTIIMVNTGTSPVFLPSPLPWHIKDNSGNVIFSPGSAGVIVTIDPGEQMQWSWNQQDNARALVPAGAYQVVFDDLSSNFIINSQMGSSGIVTLGALHNANVETNIIAKIENPQSLRDAIDFFYGLNFANIPIGKIVNDTPNKSPYDPKWRWHFDPQDIKFAETVLALCDFDPLQLEADIEGFIANTGGIYCPMGYGVVSLSGTDSMQPQLTANAVRHSWYQASFEKSYSNQTPLVLASMQTYDGSDAAGIRIRNLNQNGLEMKVEEERSRDSETAHTTEAVGLILLEKGYVFDQNNRVIGEVGSLKKSQARLLWNTLTFNRSYTNPVVLMQMTTYNGGHASHIRLRNVNSHSAQFQIEEWDYLDGWHTTEEITYVVVEAGTHKLEESLVLTAGLTSANNSWATVNFTNTLGSTPVVISRSQTHNDAAAIVTRQRNITPTSFQVRVQEEERNNQNHANESIGYLILMN